MLINENGEKKYILKNSAENYCINKIYILIYPMSMGA